MYFNNSGALPSNVCNNTRVYSLCIWRNNRVYARIDSLRILKANDTQRSVPQKSPGVYSSWTKGRGTPRRIIRLIMRYALRGNSKGQLRQQYKVSRPSFVIKRTKGTAVQSCNLFQLGPNDSLFLGSGRKYIGWVIKLAIHSSN